TRLRFRAIILAIDQYADEDSWDSREDRILDLKKDYQIRDLNFVIERLRFTDCWAFASSMHNAQSEHKAFIGCLFRGLTLRRDVQDCLLDIPGRISRIKSWPNHGLGYGSGSGGPEEDLNGL